MKIRPVTEDDREEWLRMRKALWPQHDPDMRRLGVGKELVRRAETWARSQGCLEMASDTTQLYPESPMAHRALGYEEVKHSIHFKKSLCDGCAEADSQGGSEDEAGGDEET